MDTYTILGLLMILMFFSLGWWASYQYNKVDRLKDKIADLEARLNQIEIEKQVYGDGK